MYEILSSKINECLSNEKFKELPIEIIYRILEKSSLDTIFFFLHMQQVLHHKELQITHIKDFLAQIIMIL